MKKVVASQEKIYRNLYQIHKGSTMAVSSESKEHKALRYEQICGVFENEKEVTLHDVGMGISDLYGYILDNFKEHNVTYSGSDILKEYVIESKQRYSNLNFYHRNIISDKCDDKYDYVVMSGVFHQRQDTTIKDWEEYLQEIVSKAFFMSEKAIAFNVISPFVDFYQTNVYYCNLPKLLNFINDKLSRFFAIKHNYALY